jgi:dipeptidyl aminopeptidase/acylaminoacyl peptidase
MKSSILRVFIVLAMLPAGAAAQSSFTVEQIMSAPFPSGLTAAKQGSRVAWVLDQKGARNVWVADGPQFAPRKVTGYTDDDGQAIAALTLTPDGKTAVYARGSEVNHEGMSANPRSLNVDPKQQVWAVDVDGKSQPRLLGDMGCSEEGCEDIQISPDGKWALWSTKKHLWVAPVDASQKPRQIEELRGENAEAKWSPDGKWIAFRSDRRDHSFIALIPFDASATEKAAASTVRYVSPTTNRDMAPRWSPDGKQIVFIRQPGVENKQPIIPLTPDPWAIWIADANTLQARELWHSGNTLRDSMPLFAYDSLKFAADDRIVFASTQDNHNHLYSVSANSAAPILLTPGDYSVEDVTLSADKRTIIYTSNENDVDRRHVWSVPVAGGQRTALTKGETIEVSPVQTADGKSVLVLGSSATTPLTPYLLTANSRQAVAQSTIPADFPSAQLVTPKQVLFKSGDGREIHGQLFLPKTPGKHPGIIFTHGGPIRQMLLGFHYMQYYHNAYAQNQYLVSRGYAVLSVNYRLGIMYGYDFYNPPGGGWRGSSEYQDVLAGAKYLQSLPQVDANRMGLWGGSYGGLLTALGLARNSDIFKVGVDYHGVHDWSVFLPQWENNATAAPDLKEAIKLAWESSPDAGVSTWKSPVLLIHGDDDRNVPFNQSVDLAERLRKQGVHYDEMIFPDEIHDLLLWHDWVRSYEAGAEYFDKYLK